MITDKIGNIKDCEVVLELTEGKKLKDILKEWEGCEEYGQIQDGDSVIIHNI